jgi:Purple acid Phosphatase, N-terminal domain/Calcineurin-like phosphoesterase
MASSRMTPEDAKKLSAAEQHEWFQQKRSRRRFLGAGLVTGGVLLGGPTVLPCGSARVTGDQPGAALPTVLTRATLSNGSGVVPFGRHISFGADPARTMKVAWQVASPVANPFIRIGTSPVDLGAAIPANLKNLNTPWADITEFLDSVPLAATAARAPEEQYYLHAALDGLRPGTTYYYQVGHQGLNPASGAPSPLVGTFTTAPEGPVAFTFTAFGDQGVTYDVVATANLIAAQSPAFHLHAGDISYAENGGGGLITDDYDPRAWDSYFVETAQTAAHIPWMYSLGNHEMEVWYSPDGYGADVTRLDFPGNGPAICPGTYSFTYGNVAFISLDPNDVSYEIPANLGYSHGQQTTWLAGTLAALRANRGTDFVVVFFHHCAYCTCTAHGCEGGVQQYWTPLFDQYAVDLVINGHNHIYERTDPIKAGARTTTAPVGRRQEPLLLQCRGQLRG